MKVLVTGAGGFLGGYVAGALARRGHAVRALVRPGADAPALPAGAELVRGDLRDGDAAAEAVRGADAVVHLAARMSGAPQERFAETVLATERLLEAMHAAGCRRLVLASSYAVYDWCSIDGALTEATPLDSHVYERDAYAQAKWWQERLARRAEEAGELVLTVLRPGFVWGPGRGELPGAWLALGPVRLVIAPRARLPLTYVENCAEAFAAALDGGEAAGATFNVVDRELPTAWRYVRDHLRATGAHGVRIPVPYRLARGVVGAGDRGARRALGEGARLPSVLVPRRFEARFRPARHRAARLEEALGFGAEIGYAEALARTYR